MVTIEMIKMKIKSVVALYPIKTVLLFGSRAEGTNREDSDVDLIIEFYAPVSLITLDQIKDSLEDLLGVDVDVIHGPIREGDMIEVGKTVELYAA